MVSRFEPNFLKWKCYRNYPLTSETSTGSLTKMKIFFGSPSNTFITGLVANLIGNGSFCRPPLGSGNYIKRLYGRSWFLAWPPIDLVSSRPSLLSVRSSIGIQDRQQPALTIPFIPIIPHTPAMVMASRIVANKFVGGSISMELMILIEKILIERVQEIRS